MKRGIKIVSVLLLVCFALVAGFGCGKQGGEAPKNGEGQAEAKQYVLKFGHDQMLDTPHNHAAEEFKRIVEEKTQGNVKVELYPAQQLGTGREMIEGLQLGTVEGVALPSSNFSGFDMTLSIPDLPFLFPSKEKCYEVIDGDLGDELLGLMKKHKMVGAAWWESGFKCFTGSFSIEKPDDYKGKKIRVMGNPLLIAQYEALGASAVPIDFAELYNALQQKVVDGQENPLSTIVNMRFHEVQKYITLSYHGWLPYIVAFSETWMNTLPQEYQDIIVEAAKEVAPAERAEIAKMEKERYIPEIESKGVTLIELNEEQRQAFTEKLQPVYDKMNTMLDENGQKLMQKFIQALQ